VNLLLYIFASDTSQSSVSNGFSNTGMADKTRFTLCVFMLGVMAFNPFGAIFSRSGLPGGEAYSAGFSGRQLQGVEELSSGMLIDN